MFGRPAEHSRGCHGIGNWWSCGCSWYWGRRNGKDIRETCKIIRQKTKQQQKVAVAEVCLHALRPAGLNWLLSADCFTLGFIFPTKVLIAEFLSLSWIHKTNSVKLPAYQKWILPLAQKKNTLSAFEFYHIFIAIHPNYLKRSKWKVSIEIVVGGGISFTT